MLGEHSRHADGYALVSTLHRDDLVTAGLTVDKANSISDEKLIVIADKLGDALLDCGYWDCLSGVLDHFGIKRKEDYGIE